MKRDFAEQPKTRTEQVIGQLLEFIRTGSFVGGEELPTEAELAEQLKVSRVALREAVCHLKALGIVVSKRGSGLRVGDPDLSQVMNEAARQIGSFGADGRRRLFEMRRVLELGSIADVAENSTPAHADQLTGVRTAFEECVRTPGSSAVAIELAGIAFHQTLMQGAATPLLLIVNNALREAFLNLPPDDFSCSAHSAEELEEVIREHKLIVDAIIARSPEAAYFALRRHLAFHR